MEERLITAVSSHRVLYDPSDFCYRDRNKKDLAWRAVSEVVGAPDDFCRKRWKSLRDTFLKEIKKEKEARRSGAAAGTTPKWRYLGVMSFLEPHVAPRQSSGNMRAAGEEQAPRNSPTEAAAASSVGDEQTPPEEPEEGPLSPPEASAAAAAADTVPPPCPAATPRSQRRRRARPYERSEASAAEEKIMEILQARAASTPQPVGAVQHFFNSMVPLVESMSPDVQEVVKFNIHRYIFENRNQTHGAPPLNPQ